MKTVTIFGGLSLPARDVDGTHYVAMRPLVEAHGLAWKPQFLKLKGRYGKWIKTLPFKASDGKVRRMIGAPLHVAHEWLERINDRKIDATVRSRIDASKAAVDAATRAEAERAIIDARCMKFGEEYRSLPLVPVEKAHLEKAWKGGAFTAFLGYRFIAEQAERELLIREALSIASVTIMDG